MKWVGILSWQEIAGWLNHGGFLVLIIALATVGAVLLVFWGTRRVINLKLPFPEDLTQGTADEIRNRYVARSLYRLLVNIFSLAVGLAAGLVVLSGLSRLFGYDLSFVFQPLVLWLLDPGLRLAVIILAAWLGTRLVPVAADYLDRVIAPGKETLEPEEERRLATLKNIIGSVLKVLVILVAVIMGLTEIGFNVSALLTAAGVGGLALSLGAQDLIRDYIGGFFLLAEDQVRVGDVVEINQVSGTVEQMTLRTITLRGLDGTIHIIPNRQVTMVSNMTKTFSRYIVDVEVAYKEDVDRVMGVLEEIGAELRYDEQFGPLILEPFEVLGVDQFGSSGVVIKTMITTQPLQQWAVGRELKRRIKNRFDELGIEIPFPHVSLYWGSASEPFQVDLKTAERPRE